MFLTHLKSLLGHIYYNIYIYNNLETGKIKMQYKALNLKLNEKLNHRREVIQQQDLASIAEVPVR